LLSSAKERPAEDEINRDNIRALAYKEIELMKSLRKPEAGNFKERILKEDMFWNQCQAIPHVKLKVGAQVLDPVSFP